jgi:DNA-binding PadR family transcriptional regulator
VLLDPANLYRCLRRMKEDGWIDEMRSPEDDRRRTYRITATGRAVLRDEVHRLERLLKEVRPALAGRGGERT